MPIEDICREAARLGLKGLDLIGPNDWPTLKKYGLIPTITPAAGHSLTDGINTKANHAKAEAGVRDMINRAAEFGCPNVIVLSGNRRGMSDEEGMDNCVAFLNSVKAQAEDKGVTICMELLNSKVDHPDYHCDHTAWGVEVVKRVNSPRVKLLYDIYHMQIMEGDIIRTIRNNIQYIGHFHTAGNPGRHEIDATQELNYRAIAQAIVEAGYTGYVGHEYGPVRDPLKSLAEAIEICDV
ncbi:MAG TPA: TIM barrel protein [Bryobacteraceae bacterium]|nr:TIM barrel protein [Bryobacteraceae bacterium]HOL70167.1 TIM barrel protein [Bryobacteraceae bacterium]HOQ45491.1 TIM barrel protein [Bryobacteraceae bacterium]HPQ14976.1 TIM barrel protein [Bryobacteraceae bacterium]HPU74167.1 TIM barrel protein [Bryobacteraceae bacterium]